MTTLETRHFLESAEHDAQYLSRLDDYPSPGGYDRAKSNREEWQNNRARCCDCGKDFFELKPSPVTQNDGLLEAMDAQQAFMHLVHQCLSPDKARRFAKLCATKKGRRKILAALDHEFEPAIRSDAVRAGGYDGIWGRPCFVFHQSLGFGVEFASVSEAYGRLSVEGGWLILLRDASAGIHRPEARWDDEKLISEQ